MSKTSKGVLIGLGLVIGVSLVYSVFSFKSTSPRPSAQVVPPDDSRKSKAPQRKYLLDAPVDPPRLAADALSNLTPGRILYNPPDAMRVGETLPIQVRIGTWKLGTNVLTNGLLRAPSGSPEEIRISRTMRVSLKGAADDFKIDLQSPEEQIVDDDSPTEWLWTVKPLRSGNRMLFLSAIAVVRVGGTEKVKEFPVYTTQVHIQVNPVYFLTSNWQTISGGITATGVLGWLGDRFRKRRKKRQSRAVHARSAKKGLAG